MEYKIEVKRYEGVLEDGYFQIGELQCKLLKDNSQDLFRNFGILLSKICSGASADELIPKGKTLEVIFRDDKK